MKPSLLVGIGALGLWSLLSLPTQAENLCFLEMADGRRIDLTSLCSNQEASRTATPTLRRQQPQSQALSDKRGVVAIQRSPKATEGVSTRSWRISGTIINNTNQSVDFIRISYEYKPFFSTETYTGTIIPSPSSLAPGEIAAFEDYGVSKQGDGLEGKVKILAIEWRWEDGTRGRFVPRN